MVYGLRLWDIFGNQVIRATTDTWGKWDSFALAIKTKDIARLMAWLILDIALLG